MARSATILPRNSKAAGCGCAPGSKAAMSTQHGHGFTGDCGGYNQPGSMANIAKLRTPCDKAYCSPTGGVGLVRIPYLEQLAAGVPETIRLGYSRSARFVGLTFLPNNLAGGGLNYNPDDITIRRIRTDNGLQAYPLARNNTTYQDVDPNDTELPLTTFFEGGDNFVSAIKNQQNYLPPYLSSHDIGNDSGTVQFDLTLRAGALAAQTVFFYAWVVFLQAGN